MVWRRLAGHKRWLVGALIGAVVALGWAAPAWAHAQLVGTDPEQGVVLDDSPDLVRLFFDQPIRLIPDAIRLFDADGESISAGVRVDGKTVVINPDSSFEDGAAVVEWAVGSEDGHLISGTLVFYVGAVTAPPVADETPDSRGMALVIANAFTYLGLLAGTGLAWFALAIHNRASDLRLLGGTSRILIWIGLGALLASLVLRTLESTNRLEFAALPTGSPTAAILALAGVAATSLALRTSGRGLAAIGLLLTMGSLTAVGHTRSVEPGWMMLTAGMIHTVAGAVWAGGLGGLTYLWLQGHKDEKAGVLPRGTILRFSRAAGWAVAAVAATGMGLAWRIVGSWNALVETSHGRFVLVKAGLVAVLAGLGAVNRFRLIPRLATVAARIRRSLRRNISIETAGIALLLVVTGALVEESPKLAITADLVPPQVDPQFVVGDLTATLNIDPGAVGINTASLLLRDANTDLVHPESPPELSIATVDGSRTPVSYDFVPDGYGYAASLPIPTQGTWELTLRVRTDIFTETSTLLLLDTSDGRIVPADGLVIDSAQLPKPFQGAADAVVYMTIQSSETDRLVSASSPACADVTLHESVIDQDGAVLMQHRDAIDLPGEEPVQLTSGSYHAMCEGIDPTIEIGDRLPFTITTESGQHLVISVEVVSYSDLTQHD